MKRTQIEVKLDPEENKSKWKVRLEDQETLPGTPEFSVRQVLFLEELALNNHMLLTCGPVRYQRLTIFHDGAKWIAEAEAIGPSSNEKAKSSTSGRGQG